MSLIHETACIDEGAVLGANTRIWHFSHVYAGARIGADCSLGQNCMVADGVVLGNKVKVQNNVSLYSGVTIEDEVFLGPSCVLTNIKNPRAAISRRDQYERILIRRGATVGANATILCGVTIGRHAFIAAGAVVTHNVPDYALIVGVPGKQEGWVGRHGHPLQALDEDGPARHSLGEGGVFRCVESGLRYREMEPGRLRCIDLDEDAPLKAG
ncbi:MAG: N-acetyltransferase [Deltaproteobacteria bacterium]|nr:N-acetyltransferase [Deltaproteobacteria bacterium]